MLRTATTWVRCYGHWVSRLPQATTMMFSARSRLGRSVKIALFGVGVVLPLGSLIWALLFWHGNGVRREQAVLHAEPVSPVISSSSS